MNHHIAVYRTTSEGKDRLGEFIENVSQQKGLDQWTGSSRFSVGDFVFFYFTTPTKAIVAVGIVSSRPIAKGGKVDWRSSDTRTFFCDFKPVWLLENPVHMPTLAGKNTQVKAWWGTQPFRHSQLIEPPVAGLLVAEASRLNPQLVSGLQTHGVSVTVRKTKGNGDLFTEGGTTEITKEVSRRDPRLRIAAIAKYGYVCMVCEQALSDNYGDMARDYIEMHHLKALSKQKGPYHPMVSDVIVVCPNCHRMLHRDGADPVPWKKVRAVVRNRRPGGQGTGVGDGG